MFLVFLCIKVSYVIYSVYICYSKKIFHSNLLLMKHNYHISIDEAHKLLTKANNKFVEVMDDGKMTVEYYAPKVSDEQQPHTKNELYVIASGNSGFYRNGEMIECSQGDVIFVPAHMEHRFLNFSDDFATWVIFYGDEIY